MKRSTLSIILLVSLSLFAGTSAAALRLEPADYMLKRIALGAVAFDSEALAEAVSSGHSQSFEISGQLLGLVQESDATVAQLQTPQAGVLVIRFPLGWDLPQQGENIRLLARVIGQQDGQAALELIGFTGEQELAIISPEGGLLAAPSAPSAHFASGGTSAPPSAQPPAATPTLAASGIETTSWPLGPASPTPPVSIPSFPYWSYTGPSPYSPAYSPAPPPISDRAAKFAALIKKYNQRLSDEWALALANALLYYCDWYGVHPALGFAMIACESSWNPNDVSHAGAMGLGQLMPVNVRGMGVSDPFDPMQNLNASLRLLRGQLEQYQGRPYSEQLALALACYNAGSGAVRRYGGVPPYSETINYIRKVSNLFSSLYGQGYR
jgi:hypothetical protein